MEEIRQDLFLVGLPISRQGPPLQDQALSLPMAVAHLHWRIDGVFAAKRERACRTILSCLPLDN
jgi:hypothetical protein